MSDENRNPLDPEVIERNLANARVDLIKSFLLKNFAVGIVNLNDFMGDVEADIIRHALDISEANQKKAAYLLGINAPTLCEKMKRFDIKTKKQGKANDLLKSSQVIGKLITPA